MTVKNSSRILKHWLEINRCLLCSVLPITRQVWHLRFLNFISSLFYIALQNWRSKIYIFLVTLPWECLQEIYHVITYQLSELSSIPFCHTQWTTKVNNNNIWQHFVILSPLMDIICFNYIKCPISGTATRDMLCNIINVWIPVWNTKKIIKLQFLIQLYVSCPYHYVSSVGSVQIACGR